MCTLIIDADSLVYKAAAIATTKRYDILPLTVKGQSALSVLDSSDPESYEEFVIKTFAYVRDYKEWLASIGKAEEAFTRIPQEEPGPLSLAISTLNSMLTAVMQDVQPSDTRLLVSGAVNFRDKVARLRPYKESRKDKPKPHHYAALRAYAVATLGAEIAEGCEADDMCGILAESCRSSDTPFVIAGIDKDLLSIPGTHYNYEKRTWQYVTEKSAYRWFWMQVLTGDSTDCIPGLKGVGPKAAEKILGKCASYGTCGVKVREAYQDIFKKQASKPEQLYAAYKDSDEVMTEMGQLIHMQRFVGEVWRV